MKMVKASLFIVAALGFLVLCSSAWAVEPNLVSHWKFDEGSGTIAYDSAGSNDGTIYGAQWTAGQIDGALDFDGVDDYVDVGDPPDGSLDFGTSTDFSISLWFNTSGPKVGFFVCKRAKGYYAGYDFYIESDGKVFARIADGSSISDARTTEGFNDGLWHHAVAVYDRDGQITIYVDNVSKATSVSIAGMGNIDNSQPFTIGDRNDPGWHAYFDGSIDDVRIYDRALSAGEVEELYWTGIGGSGLAIFEIEQALAEKEAALDVIDVALEKESVAYEALEELLESGDYGDLKKGDIVKAEQKIHSAIQHEEQSLDTLEKSIEKLYDALAALGWEPEPEPNLVSHWKFDEGSGTIAYDSAGDNDGTIYGEAVWTTGQIDGALDFDGVDDYVDCGTGPAITGTGTFTSSAWVKVTELPVSGALVVVNQRSTLANDGSYLIDVLSSGYVHFEVFNGGYGFYFNSDVSVGDGFWHHIVGVRTSTTEGEIYVDGKLAGSGSGPARSLSNFDVVVGRWNGGSLYFNGIIDDVRIYNRALSAEEIQELYLDGLSGSGKGKSK
jgi:hypothetical protein